MGVNTRASIKSIQRGLITLASGAANASATITAVNTAKSQIRLIGSTNQSNSSFENTTVRLSLTSSTQIAAIRVGTVGIVEAAYEVTEWN